jgi:hypothetical protein
MLNLEEETRGNVFFNYDASGRIKRVGFAYMTQPFRLEQGGGLQILHLRGYS